MMKYMMLPAAGDSWYDDYGEWDQIYDETGHHWGCCHHTGLGGVVHVLHVQYQGKSEIQHNYQIWIWMDLCKRNSRKY